MGGILVCLLMGLMIFGIVMIFVPYSKYMQMVYGGAGAILFSFYLVYDTQVVPQIDPSVKLYNHGEGPY